MQIDDILMERQERYGTFKTHASLSRRLKLTLMAHPGWENTTYDQQEALDMICHKIARILNGDPDYVDSWDDIAGYATLVSKILRGENP